MGCDTKGYVITENKDVQQIALKIKNVVESINGNSEWVANANYSPTIQYHPESNFLTVPFKDGDDQRIVWVFLGCDCDIEQGKMGDSGIIISFGAWGNSVTLMKKFLEAFLDMGVCYLHENDCVGEPVFYKPMILLYSAKAAKAFGYNTILTTEGKNVQYTCINEDYNWREHYLWEDAIEVGYANSVNDITGFFPSHQSNFLKQYNEYWTSDLFIKTKIS